MHVHVWLTCVCVAAVAGAAAGQQPSTAELSVVGGSVAWVRVGGALGAVYGASGAANDTVLVRSEIIVPRTETTYTPPTPVVDVRCGAARTTGGLIEEVLCAARNSTCARDEFCTSTANETETSPVCYYRDGEVQFDFNTTGLVGRQVQLGLAVGYPQRIVTAGFSFIVLRFTGGLGPGGFTPNATLTAGTIVKSVLETSGACNETLWLFDPEQHDYATGVVTSDSVTIEVSWPADDDDDGHVFYRPAITGVDAPGPCPPLGTTDACQFVMYVLGTDDDATESSDSTDDDGGGGVVELVTRRFAAPATVAAVSTTGGLLGLLPLCCCCWWCLFAVERRRHERHERRRRSPRTAGTTTAAAAASGTNTPRWHGRVR